MPVLDGTQTENPEPNPLGAAAEPNPAPGSTLYGNDVYLPNRLPAGLKPVASPGAARTCGSSSCNGGWIAPWKNRKRPIFEQEWACSGRCLKTMVQAAIRREMEGSPSGMELPHRHRVPLGLVLLAQGWITHPQLQAALEAQKANGAGRIGDWLMQSCGLPEERITRGLGVQWSCPVLALNGFSPSAMALVMPKRFVAEFGLVPLRVAGSSLLYLAFEDRMNASAALAIEHMSGLKVESGLLSGSQFERAKKALLEAEAAPMTSELLGNTDELCTRLTRLLEEKQPLASRLVRVHQYYWMRLWLETGALGDAGTLPPGPADVQDYLFSVKGTQGAIG